MKVSQTASMLLEGLAQPTPSAVLWDLARTYLEDLGFDRIFRISLARGSEVEVQTTMPDAFLRDYQSEGFSEVDPFIPYCLPAPQSFATGIAHVDEHGYLSPRAKGLIEHAAHFGFRAGFSVTTHCLRPEGGEGWNLGSSQSAAEVAALRRHYEREIRFCLTALLGRLSTKEVSLTQREREALQLLAVGLRNRQIADAMGVREVTVEMHLANARRKLGAATREQAIAQFCRLGRSGRV